MSSYQKANSSISQTEETQMYNDQQSLLVVGSSNTGNTASRRPIQHYDSLPDSEASLAMEEFSENTDNGAFQRSSCAFPKPARVSRRKVMGASVAVGLLILSVLSFAGQDMSDMMSIGSDDDYPYYSSSIVDLLPVPLLGRSKSYKAQKTADRARTDLYLDPNTARHNAHHSRLRLWGSSSSHHRHDDTIQISAPDGCEGTVMLLRHCEKGSIREHCNYQGYERSVYLASLFGDDASARWPTPSFIFAEAPGGRRNRDKKNFREIETIMPLAEKFNMSSQVDTSYTASDSHALARHIHGLFRDGKMCGKLAVVSWKHSKIPTLASALACGPKQGCPHRYPGSEFDSIWQLKFAYRTPLHSDRKHLQEPKHKEWLLFGSVQKEEFDPLAFSKRVGDYMPEINSGSSARHSAHHAAKMLGAAWRDMDYEVPERTVFDAPKKRSKKDKKH